MHDDGPMGEKPRARWRAVDAAWYLRRYPDAARELQFGSYADVAEYYDIVGKARGHSPNPFFDENWYRQRYPEIYREVCLGQYLCAFDHYCAEGLHTHSPHWLFSEREYRRRYPDITNALLAEGEYENGYDHFLRRGGLERRSGSLFFDVEAIERIAEDYPEHFAETSGYYESYLGLDAKIADAVRASWFFDPVWYLECYPQARQAIAEGRFTSAVHHYFCNETPRNFNPQAFFDEAFYGQTHADVLPSIEAGQFRNGYDHFLKFGADEGRRPEEGVDLAAFLLRPQVRSALRSGRFANVFACWVAQHAEGAPQVASPPDENQTRDLFVSEAHLSMQMVFRRGLDFQFSGVPELSVIMVVHDQIALTAQALASLRANHAGPIELILVDSGSHDETCILEQIVQGARVLRYRTNIGYLEGCNAALAVAQAPAVLYLNNDVRLYPNAVGNALSRLYSADDIGAVGAKLLRTNMRLQEAGSIIWRDGATYGYRREDDPNIGEANFVRDVDYCSAAFLVVRTDVARELGGFDPLYRPAYFEDADFCLRLIQSGSRVIYDPTVMVEHLEFGSSGTTRSQAQIKANHRLFGRQHQDYLRLQQPAHVRNAVLARSRRNTRRKILLIEDRLPFRSLGSGYVRSNDVIWAMSALNYQITVFPVLPRPWSHADLADDFPEDVELMNGSDLSGFVQFIEERAGYYDVVWVGRTHNMDRVLPILTEASRYLPPGGAILDTEVVAAPRILERARVLKLSAPQGTLDDLLREELDCAHYCQQIVAVTEHDATLIRRAGYGNVSVLGHCVVPRPTPRDFAERQDMLFVGALHDEDAPNYDSLLWMVREVLPLLEEALPADAMLTVAGFSHPSVDMTPLTQHPRVRWLGAVADLAPLYDRHRVFVAPTRFAGGLPYKVHEAASFGVPVVATTLLADQVGWQNGVEIATASADDAGAFARAVVELYTDETVWRRTRKTALEAIARECSPSGFKAALEEILRICVR